MIDKAPVETRYGRNSPIEEPKIDKAILERKIEALEAALECSKTGIICLKLILELKNEAILWNTVTLVILFIMLSYIIIKFLVI